MKAVACAAFTLLLAMPLLRAEVVPLSPEDGSTFETLTDEQIAVFGGETRTNRLRIVSKLKTAPKEVWQRQRPLVLKWKATEGESEPWRVRLSTRPDFSDGRDLWFDRRELAHEPEDGGKSEVWTCPVPLANLELGKKYYWQVWSDVKCKEFRCGFTYPGGCKCGKSRPGRISSVMSFTTTDRAPRWIALEGRTDNVRDVGGWRTADGGRVRMGLVYRGTAFNDNSVAGLNRGRSRLTVEDVRYLTEELGIKTDLDLRSPREVAGMTESPLGPNVKFVNVVAQSYQGLFTDVGKEAMAKNFRLFCDMSNYPIYFHCIHGVDRTGSLAYILNGLLGVGMEDLERDWEAATYPKLSGVRNPWSERACAHYDRGFAQYGKPGDTLAERIRLYLLDCGITQSEINAFKSIMLEGQSLPDTSAGKKSDGGIVLSNRYAAVEFNVENGTFTIRDAEGRVRLTDAGVGATSVKRGAAFKAKTDEVNDAFGHGKRITFTVRDDTVGARWGFHAAGYQHPHSKGGWEPVYAYTLYDDSPAIIASFGVNTPVWYRRRLMSATVVRGGKWLGGGSRTPRPAEFVTINSAAGAEPAHLIPGLTRNSANGLVVTGLVDGRRRTLVAGGLKYDAFGKFAELDDGSLTLYAADEVGVLVEPDGVKMFADDTFYIDAVTDDPFASAEAYGRAMRKANGADPNVYDFPLLCGWAVGALSKLGNINNSPALVKELDLAGEKGFTKYSKVGVRLEPDYYCYHDHGNTEQGWYDNAHWSKYGHLRAPYDTFAKWCAAIKERNGIPYTYIQVGMPSDDFAIAHRDWMIFNSTNRIERKHMHHRPYVTYDFTDKGLSDHMFAMWRRLRNDGMQGIKFDYPETGYTLQGGFDDIHASATQVYRRYFAIARDGLGKDAYLDERNLGECGRPCLDATAGIVDTQRTWSDSNKFDPRMITTDGLRWFKMRTVFNYYPDSKAIHGLSEGVRRSMLTTVYLTSGRIELATSFRLFTPEMTHDLSRLYPEYREPFAARPIDAFKQGVVNPSVYDLELSPMWHQVMLFNPEKDRAVVKTALCGDRATDGALGLDPAAKWRVHSFWGDAYLGILGANDALEMELGGLECEMFRVTKAEEHPQVVSTTRHVLQGWMDISGEKWDATERVLSGTARHIAPGTTESVVVATDTADGKVFQFVKAEVSPEDAVAGVKVTAVETNGTVRISLTVPIARDVKWRAVFGN